MPLISIATPFSLSLWYFVSDFCYFFWCVPFKNSMCISFCLEYTLLFEFFFHFRFHTVHCRRRSIFPSASGIGKIIICLACEQYALCGQFCVVLVCDSLGVSSLALFITNRGISLSDSGDCSSVCIESDWISVWLGMERLENHGPPLF